MTGGDGGAPFRPRGIGATVSGVSVAPAPPPDPLDQERRAAQARLEVAVGEGGLTLDEFAERAGRVWSASDPAEVRSTLLDLPVPIVGQRPRARSTLVGFIGDIRRRGRWSVPRRTTAWLVLGDVKLDLRGALVGDHDELVIEVNVVLGDVKVVVPEGVEVELTGFTLLGDRRIELAPVTRVPGTPVVRVRVYSVLGDATVRSAR